MSADEMLNNGIKELLKSTVDLSAFTALNEKRNKEFAEVREALGLNVIERVLEAAIKPNEEAPTNNKSNTNENEIESDEIFTASKSSAKVIPILPSELEKRYVRVGNVYYYAANTKAVAFEDKGNSLTTKSDGEGMASSLVAIANARGWDEIKVSGSETFKREVWLEAAAKGMQVKGYSPNESDLATLEKRVSESKAAEVTKNFRGREKNSDDAEKDKDKVAKEIIYPNYPNEKLAKAFELNSPVEAAKKHPELAGAAALTTAVFERHASNLNENEKKVVLDQVKKNVVASIANGNIPDIKVAEKKQDTTRTKQNETGTEKEKDLSL